MISTLYILPDLDSACRQYLLNFLYNWAIDNRWQKATAAGVNPTSMIMALALRAADKIWEKRRDWN